MSLFDIFRVSKIKAELETVRTDREAGKIIVQLHKNPWGNRSASGVFDSFSTARARAAMLPSVCPARLIGFCSLPSVMMTDAMPCSHLDTTPTTAGSSSPQLCL
jgi:hypothetical protein